jgi:hypothetical protein
MSGDKMLRLEREIEFAQAEPGNVMPGDPKINADDRFRSWVRK